MSLNLKCWVQSMETARILQGYSGPPYPNSSLATVNPRHCPTHGCMEPCGCWEPGLTVGRIFSVLRYVGRHTKGQQGHPIDDIEICCNL